MSGIIDGVCMRHAHYDHGTGKITDVGDVEVQKVVEQLRDQGFSPEVIYHSGAVRACDTALSAAGHFNLSAEKVISNELLHENEVLPTAFTRLLRKAKASEYSRVLCVTHGPYINALGYLFSSIADVKVAIQYPYAGSVRFQYNSAAERVKDQFRFEGIALPDQGFQIS